MTTAFPVNSDIDKDVEFSIRKGVSDDIPQLVSIERECFSSPWSEKSFEDFFLHECSFCLVAEAGGVLCGYVGMYIICGEGEITNLAVRSEYRREGVGTALMKSLCDAEKISRLTLDVRESNVAAYTLYKKLGFKVDGKRKKFYEKPREDAILMSNDIKR